MRLLPLAFLASLLSTPLLTPAADKYLIEFGWDEPTTSFMKSHITRMEQTPFDGTVFHLEATNPDGSTANFMNEFWGTRAFTADQLQAAEENLKTTPFKRFTHNFLRVNVIPGEIDWFDDHSAITNNARHAARIASSSPHVAGILFDIEAYNGQLWNHSKQKRTQDHPWPDYAKQAQSRGRDLMQAFQQGWKTHAPNRPLIIFLTFGYSLPHRQASGDRAKLETQEYGLLAPFLDGMYAAADEHTTIVDGFEFAYSYKDESQLQSARDLVFKELPTFVANRDQYLKHTSLAFGFWMDYDWRNKGWNETDPTKNYFTPAQFQKTLELGLRHSDRYVWIYTEKPRWWTQTTGPTSLPTPYIDAIRNAKKGVTP